MPTLTIKRSKQRGNSARKIRIYIDNELAGEIANGETCRYEIAEGHHIAIARIDWCSSYEVSFTVKETENKTLYLSGMELLKTFNPLQSFSHAIYYITIGRKEFLKLEERPNNYFA